MKRLEKPCSENLFQKLYLDFRTASRHRTGTRRPPCSCDAIAAPKTVRPTPTYALVESVRTEAGPRQRVVAHLGELNHDEQRRWQRTVLFHNRQGDGRQLRLFPDDDQVCSAGRPRCRTRQPEIRRVGESSPVRRRLARTLALATSQTRRDRRPACPPRQGDRSDPADIVAIEVINRLCAPCCEFALAEHWYASTGLEDLLGVPDSASPRIDSIERWISFSKLTKRSNATSKHRLRHLVSTRLQPGALRPHQHVLRRNGGRETTWPGAAIPAITAATASKSSWRLSSPETASRCAHRTFAGNTQDLKTVQTIVTLIEAQFGKSRRIWVMDRGMISDDVAEVPRRVEPPLPAGHQARRVGRVSGPTWERPAGRRLSNNPQVEVKLFEAGRSSVPAGPQSTATPEGTSHSPSPTSRPGAGPEEAGRSHRHGQAQGARQDPRASRASRTSGSRRPAPS